MLLNVGSGGGAAAAPSGGAAGGASADGPAETKEEEKKEEGMLIIFTHKAREKRHADYAILYRERRVGRGHGLRSLRLDVLLRSLLSGSFFTLFRRAHVLVVEMIC